MKWASKIRLIFLWFHVDCVVLILQIPSITSTVEQWMTFLVTSHKFVWVEGKKKEKALFHKNCPVKPIHDDNNNNNKNQPAASFPSIPDLVHGSSRVPHSQVPDSWTLSYTQSTWKVLPFGLNTHTPALPTAERFLNWHSLIWRTVWKQQ